MTRKAVNSNDLGQALCELLGLDWHFVQEIVVVARINEAPTVNVRYMGTIEKPDPVPAPQKKKLPKPIAGTKLGASTTRKKP